MAKANKNSLSTTIENSLSNEVILELKKDREEFIEDAFAYKLPDALKDNDYPLTFSEKKELVKISSIEEIESDQEKFDKFLTDICDRRKIAPEVIDNIQYSDLVIFGKRIILGTFDAKAIVLKKSGKS